VGDSNAGHLTLSAVRNVNERITVRGILIFSLLLGVSNGVGSSSTHLGFMLFLLLLLLVLLLLLLLLLLFLLLLLLRCLVLLLWLTLWLRLYLIKLGCLVQRRARTVR
jgi:hypothetical protein